MKILFDTNLLVPIWLFPNGVCAKSYDKAFDDKRFSVVICTYVIEEFLNICDKKFSDRMPEIQLFLSDILSKTTLIRTPPENEKIPEEELIRDVKDRPILRAAVAAKVDIIVTGDKDFLEPRLANIITMSPADFVNF